MTFTPSRLVISSITNANPAVVTTTTNHDLATGQVVRINIPSAYGMQQLNKALVQIKSLSSATFSIWYSLCENIQVNSLGFTPFSVPGSPVQQAEVIPVGSSATPLSSTPPQILNNTCDSTLVDQVANIAT